jgi:DNA-binding CsgD family transcriptional regulator
MARGVADFPDLVGAVYEAGFDSSLWPAFLAKFQTAVGGYGTGLLISDTNSAANSVTITTLPPEHGRSYNEYYSLRNPWLDREGRSFLLGNEAGVGESVLSASDLKRTEFYEDWLRPQGALHAIGTTVMRMPSFFVLLSSLREAYRGPFTEREVRLLTRLRPHMRRAVEAQRRNAVELQARDASIAVLDRLPYGWIVANATGRAIHRNAAAKRVMDRGEVDLRHPELARLIAHVAKSGLGGDLALSRGKGRPLWISALPLRTPAGTPFASSTLVGIVISDPDQAPLTDPERIRRFWKLTPAESDLAAELARGLDLASAAEGLGIARTTARNQLRSILGKTGAHRQSELVRLLMSAPPQFRVD